MISPQPWGKMKVSKHHYAIELAKRGNKVYFLNPPSASVKRGTVLSLEEPEKGLTVLAFRPTFPMRWKNRFEGVFNYFTRRDVQKLLFLMGGEPDIVWDFEPNRLFADLNIFRAALRIYHPVDITPFMNNETKNADVIFSVSEIILDYFRKQPVPYHFINHGLGTAFGEMAKERLAQLPLSSSGSKIRFGYVGNLLMRYIDHQLYREVITRHPNVEFHIWGPYDTAGLNVPEEDEERIRTFIQFLREQPNVHLYGMQGHDSILPVMKDLDGFFWCYDNERDPNKGSNSHKIMEYLSTGKVLVSTHISTYSSLQNKNLIVMNNSREEFLEKFAHVIGNMEQYNSEALMRERIQMALKNTYSSHIGLIEELLAGKVNQRMAIKAKD